MSLPDDRRPCPSGRSRPKGLPSRRPGRPDALLSPRAGVDDVSWRKLFSTERTAASIWHLDARRLREVGQKVDDGALVLGRLPDDERAGPCRRSCSVVFVPERLVDVLRIISMRTIGLDGIFSSPALSSGTAASCRAPRGAEVDVDARGKLVSFAVRSRNFIEVDDLRFRIFRVVILTRPSSIDR